MKPLLAAVNGLLGGAPEELKPALGTVRNALVKEAVDFSEACQETTGVRPVQPATPSGQVTAGARVLSVQAGQDELEQKESRRGRLLWVVLVLAALGAGAFHGYRWLAKEQAIAALPSLPGAPERMTLLPSAPNSPKVLLPVKGPPDRAQVERFKAEQEKLGNEVIELEGGGLSVSRKPPPPPPQERVPP